MIGDFGAFLSEWRSGKETERQRDEVEKRNQTTQLLSPGHLSPGHLVKYHRIRPRAKQNSTLKNRPGPYGQPHIAISFVTARSGKNR